MVMKIKWNKKAVTQLEQAIEYISKDSLINAEKVQREIILAIDALQIHPEKYHPDKYKIANDKSYRAFELYHYRISYRYKVSEIRIVRIRHTKMNPIAY
jgi:plasmid stabilization system protein ParE